jgi:hypothetical protein
MIEDDWWKMSASELINGMYMSPLTRYFLTCFCCVLIINSLWAFYFMKRDGVSFKEGMKMIDVVVKKDWPKWLGTWPEEEE